MLQAVLEIMENCGQAFSDHVDVTLIELTLKSLHHPNRFVRETCYHITAVLCGLMAGQLLRSHAGPISRQLRDGLSENWSQVCKRSSATAWWSWQYHTFAYAFAFESVVGRDTCMRDPQFDEVGPSELYQGAVVRACHMNRQCWQSNIISMPDLMPLSVVLHRKAINTKHLTNVLCGFQAHSITPTCSSVQTERNADSHIPMVMLLTCGFSTTAMSNSVWQQIVYLAGCWCSQISHEVLNLPTQCNMGQEIHCVLDGRGLET